VTLALRRRRGHPCSILTPRFSRALWTSDRFTSLRGGTAACERELREAHRLYTEMGATGHAERLAEELGL